MMMRIVFTDIMGNAIPIAANPINPLKFCVKYNRTMKIKPIERQIEAVTIPIIAAHRFIFHNPMLIKKSPTLMTVSTVIETPNKIPARGVATAGQVYNVLWEGEI